MKPSDESLLRSLSSSEILGLTLTGEARGEPIEGIVAVASVIRNRLQMSGKKSYHDICLAPEQFSCWNESDPNYAFLVDCANKLVNTQKLTDIYIRQCMVVATGIVNWDIRDNTNSALNYLTEKLFYSTDRPRWARIPKTTPIKLGSQVFFEV